MAGRVECDQSHPWCRLIMAMHRHGAVEIRRAGEQEQVVWQGKVGVGATVYAAVVDVYRQVYQLTDEQMPLEQSEG